MSNKFKVTIFKKTKGASYTDHVIVRRKSPASDHWHPYNDTVHLYFDKGVLARFVHVQDAPKGKKIWNFKSERYEDLEPKHQVANEFIMKNGKVIYLKEQTRNQFYLFGYSYPNETRITFCNDQTRPGFFDYFRIVMDSNGKWCNPDGFDQYQNDMAAEIKEVYTTKRTKTLHPAQVVKKSIEY